MYSTVSASKYMVQLYISPVLIYAQHSVCQQIHGAVIHVTCTNICTAQCLPANTWCSYTCHLYLCMYSTVSASIYMVQLYVSPVLIYVQHSVCQEIHGVVIHVTCTYVCTAQCLPANTWCSYTCHLYLYMYSTVSASKYMV